MCNLRTTSAYPVVLAALLVSCGGPAEPPPASPSSSVGGSPPPTAESPSPSPSESLADDFSDESTGWDEGSAAVYRAGELVVGGHGRAGYFVHAPSGFDEPAVVSASGRIEGSGPALIGLFCGTSVHLRTGYVGFVDPEAARATITRLTPSGPKVMGEGTHIDEVVSLKQPLALQLACTRSKIVFQIDGTTVAIGADPIPFEGPAGGVYFENVDEDTVGIFDDFDMMPI